jgi:hypothetical protein
MKNNKFDEIRKNMETRSTEDLLKIWKENNRKEWSDEAFVIVKKILLDRKTIPHPQHKNEPTQTSPPGTFEELSNEPEFQKIVVTYRNKIDIEEFSTIANVIFEAVTENKSASKELKKSKDVITQGKMTALEYGSLVASLEKIFKIYLKKGILSDIKPDESNQMKKARLSELYHSQHIPETIKKQQIRTKVSKTAAVIIIAFVWWLFVFIKNPSNFGQGITYGHLLQAGVIFFIAVIILRKIWKKRQEEPYEQNNRKNSEKKGTQLEEPREWDYCENCGKKGAQLFKIVSSRSAFCSESCQETFRNKLYQGNTFIFCPYCGSRQPVIKEYPRICRQCRSNMDNLPDKSVSLAADYKSQEITAIIIEAEKTLFQSNDPDYEISLYERLLQCPETTIQAIQSWGWKRRGTAEEELNRFLTRALGEIYKRTEGEVKGKASDALVQIFTTPDDNTTGWSNLLETAAKIIAKNQMLEAKQKLEDLKKNVTEKNQQAIDYTLTLLKEV